MTLWNRLVFSHGLMWQRNRPPLRKLAPIAGMLGILAGIYLLGHLVTAQAEELEEVVQGQSEKFRLLDRVLGCLNGKPLGEFRDGGKTIVVLCRLEEVTVKGE